MSLPTIGWDDVVERFRTFERFSSIRSTAAAMLRLVAALREDPRLEGVGRSVSHVSLILMRGECDRHVLVSWSEPGGIGWIDQEGFVVAFVEFRDLAIFDRIVVSEGEVVTTIHEYLHRLA